MSSVNGTRIPEIELTCGGRFGMLIESLRMMSPMVLCEFG